MRIQARVGFVRCDSRRSHAGAGFLFSKIIIVKLTEAEKHANKVAKIAERLRAMSPGNQINDVAKVFQKVVRMKAADEYGMCKCVTCDAVRPWNDLRMNAGHFVTRKSRKTIFLFVNCHPQCVACNQHLSGNAAEYDRYMIATFGQQVVDDLKAESRESIKWTCEELAEKKIQFMELARKESARLK